MDQNICKFAPIREYSENRILHFVYEQNPSMIEVSRIQSWDSLYLVTEGSGILHTASGNFHISKGTLFITFSGQNHCIEQRETMKYIYISFIGKTMEANVSRVGLNSDNAVRYIGEELIYYWRNALELAAPQNIDLLAESVLLYSLACVASDNSNSDEDSVDKRKKDHIAERVRAYVDEHFCDSSISLTAIAEMFSYSPKYLSDSFSRTFGIGFREYIKSLRIQRACELIQDGITSSKEISYLIGFDDPLYFSKVFTRIVGVSPQKHIADMKNQKQ